MDLLQSPRIEGKPDAFSERPCGARESHEAKPSGALDAREDAFMVVEGVQRHESFLGKNVLEELAGRFVRSDPGLENAADSTRWAENAPIQLGEDSKGIDVPDATKRVRARTPYESTRTFRT